MFQTSIRVKDIDNLLEIFGNLDGNISIIEKRLEVTIILRNDEIKITGTKEQNIQNAAKVLTVLSQIKDTITDQTVDYTISMILEDKVEQIKALSENCIFVTALGKPIKPKTIGQKEYIKAVSNNIITFAVGPAGTGKTYLAVAMAVKALKSGEISRIILTRPAVEAGEKLGFLPGDLQTKVDPYLRPLYDALFDMLGAEGYQRQLEKGVIEIAPLAYMRGRTLDESFIILDEAQNTTKEQMKMFLTRLGNNSKAVVTGDITQIDLPKPQDSGIIDATSILTDIEGISTIRLTPKDVVRNRLVSEIIKAYDNKFKKEK